MSMATDTGRQKGLLVVSVLTTVLGAVAVILRIVSRFMIRKLGWDDYIMIVALIFMGGYLFEIGYGLRFGMGLHTYDDSLADMLIFAIQLTYNTIVSAIKISILCFHLRLATADRGLRNITLGSIGVIGAFYITIAAVFNIVADIWVLALPVKTLWNIKRHTRDKIVLLIVFGFGSLSCLSSMIRLYTIRVFTDSDDPFFDGIPINILSMIEISIAIICASVPAMKPLFTGAVRERTKGSTSSQNAFGSKFGHQMMPLGDNERGSRPSFSGTRKASNHHYSIKGAASDNDTGSKDRIMPPRKGGIELEVQFSVEESYLESGSSVKTSPGVKHTVTAL